MLKMLACTLMTYFHSVNPLLTLVGTFERERSRWVYWAPVALAAGIVVYFELPFEPSLWALAIVPVIAAGAWFVRHLSWAAAIILFVLALAGLGFSAAQVETRMDERPMLDRDYGPVPIAGRVAMTELMPDGIRLTLTHPRIGHLPPEATPEKIRIKLKDLTLDDAPPTGAEINLYGQVGPFSEPVAPGATDFRWQSYFKHLGGLGWGYGKITVEDPAPPTSSIREKFSLMFERARKTLARHVYDHLSGDIAAMTATRLNGEQTAISPPVIEAMRIAGLSHLLSTSGFHVTIMGLLIYFPLRMIFASIPWLALRYPIKKWAAGAAIFSALGYTFLVGSQAATLRSMIMTGLAMLAITVDRRATALRLVMLSAGIGMLIEPDATMGPSFQMSFAAVFCLIVANQKAWDWASGDFTDFMPEWFKSVTAHIWGIARTSLIATAATTPFAIYHFQTLSLYGFIANVVAIPITSFWVMPSILLAYITAPFGLDGIFIDAAGAGVAITIHIATTVAAWPYSIFYWPAMPGFALAIIVLGGLWLCIWREKWRYLGLLPIIIGMMYPLYTPKPDFFVTPDGREWAARLDDGRLAVSNLDHDKFSVTQWQQRLGNVETIDSSQLPPDNAQIRCDQEGCVYRHGEHVLAMPEMESATLEDCQHADIIIAPFIIKPSPSMGEGWV
ncbi:MAG: ComEC/Rec2 family competence protein, partial [Alphaproteobacteria bacterium]